MAVGDTTPGLALMSESFGTTVKENGTKTNSETDGHTDNSVEETKAADKSPDTTDTNGTLEAGKDPKETAVEAAEKKKEEPQAEPGSISSAHTIYRVKDKDGEWTWSSDYPENVVEAAENEETAKYAVVVRSMKSSDSRKKLEAHSIVIQSPQLKEALGEILKDYPGISCDIQRVVFAGPFQPFMHRWSDMLQYLGRKDLDDTTREHLTILVDILKEELRDDIKAYEDYLSKGITTFDHAWMVFQPGALVISESLGPLAAYELIEGEYTACQGVRFLRLECEVVDWSGDEFGRYKQYLSIQEFKGAEKFTNLAAFPLAFHPNKESVVAGLIEQGKKFESLAGYHFKSYTGIAISWNHEGQEVAMHHSGRIVIDCKSFNRYSPYSGRGVKEFRAKDKQKLIRKNKKIRSQNLLKAEPTEEESSVYELTDYFLLICYNRVRGYSLSVKKWLDFYIPFVEDITWNTRAFDSLVLPEDQKELILAFTESQVQNRQGFDDVVKGKGQGIIILLAGKPGIGKTLTAESVAEDMRRPLHTIGSGDLGSDAWNIENKLTEILDLVGRWNAVLLLDECDVFLEARSNRDLDRNALVSTFLRVLEYYNGILFMTTNRADNIDPAFESRIHVSMQYPDLNSSARKRIWSNFLSSQQHALEDKDLDELAEVELNGRQIKNIIKTSHLLASRKKQKLSMREIGTVLDIENRRPEKRNKQ